MTDPFQDLTTLEADLSHRCALLAQVLALPPSQERSARLNALWREVAPLRPAYEAAVQALRGRITEPTDQPLQAAARRSLLQHAPGRAAMWEKIERMIARQQDPSSFPPLIVDQHRIVRGPEAGPVDYLVQLLFQLSNPLAGQGDLVPDTHYRDIPLSGGYFLNLLMAARRLLLAMEHDGPVRFLDMGCGGGSKVLIASAMFDEAEGADFLPAYIAQGREFFTRVGADPDRLRVGDALRFDDYGAYDVIYFYRPLKDPALAAQMEARVLAQVRPGTILLAPLNATLGRSEIAAARVVDKIYLAHSERAEAARLADLARIKGCETRGGVSDDAQALGFWAPVITQSRRNGFVVW